MKRLLVLVPIMALTALSAACGGNAEGDSVLKVDGPSFEPQRIAIQTLEPGPAPTPTPSPSPTPSPTEQPPGVPAPKVATVRSAAGVQQGDVRSYCWYEQPGGKSKCYTHDEPSQSSSLRVKQKEKVLLKLDAQIPPNEEAIRPFQGTRSGFPDQPIDPAQETELTIDLPKGTWSMDLCATWHGRGQPICWLFQLEIV
jgi:hypothetical protein